MTIIYAGIYYKLNNNNVFKISTYYNLINISYFKKKYAKDFIHLLAREFIKSSNEKTIFSTMEHTQPNYNYLINIMSEDNKYYYIIITECSIDIKLSRLILCDFATEFKKYLTDNKIPKYILNDIEIDNQLIASIIEKHWNKTNNKINKIKENLTELTDIMKNNIETIIIRDIKIQELLEKTDNLNQQSIEFKKSASKLNKCCGWW